MSDVAVVVGVGAALGEELFVAAAGPDAVAVLAHCGGGGWEGQWVGLGWPNCIGFIAAVAAAVAASYCCYCCYCGCR